MQINGKTMDYSVDIIDIVDIIDNTNYLWTTNIPLEKKMNWEFPI